MSKTFALLSFILSALWLGNVQAEETSKEMIEKGRKEFEMRCMHCHGDQGDGKGHLNAFLKIAPADLTQLNTQSNGCVTERILKAVLGRHSTTDGKHNMPLLVDVLTPESIYLLAQYIKSIQK
jgi:mono/diheme cytochrome c family protein